MLNFRIIEYGSCDYHDMVALRDEILRKPLGLTFSEDYLQKEINDVLIGAFYTENNSTSIVGCCILTPSSTEENVVQLRQMAVASNVQRKGIGSDIISYAEDLARNDGFKVLMMHARKEAAGFYQKLGYAITGNEFTEVGIPHFEMRKNLN
ncbi:GNAT family N-acetyltransferase [Chitinophaga sp. CB10]|uniref:GNAT family N-acetyltransferase n=1 Tax=Chitinophaga sp. CB10 TaxID=1891659 RepID=UPI0025B8E2A4|nr:GNAT family N-acetyltransferase [Chitinophaga sp. CB10]